MIVWGSNMFNKIWKEQIAKPKGKLGIWKPKQELQPREEEEEDKCCEEAKKYLHYFLLMQGFTVNSYENYTCEQLKNHVKREADVDRFPFQSVRDYVWSSIDLFWDDCEEEFVEAELWHTKENWIWGEAPREDAWDKV